MKRYSYMLKSMDIDFSPSLERLAIYQKLYGFV